MVHVTSPTSLAVDVPQGRKLFVFDRVFPETTDQEGIWEYVSDSVNSFLQGYNVSILAYGQSGAGKSYTMGTGSPNAQNDPKSMGTLRDLPTIPKRSAPFSFFFFFLKATADWNTRNHSTRSSDALRETWRAPQA